MQIWWSQSKVILLACLGSKRGAPRAFGAASANRGCAAMRGPVLRWYKKTSAWLGRYCTRKRIVLFVGVWLMSLFLSSGDAALSRWYSTDGKGAAVSASRPTRKTRPAGGPERQTGDSANGRKKAWRHRGPRYRRNLAIAGHRSLLPAQRTPHAPLPRQSPEDDMHVVSR